MQSSHFLKACLLTVALALVFIACWEWYWRDRGFRPTFNDDRILWASKRKEIYNPADQATVFIGASRIKFALDIPTWEKLTGEEAIQLAIVGSSCRPTLQDLADDEKFKGKLIVDATEFTLFSGNTGREKSVIESLEYYRNETPSQQFSSLINQQLESRFVFLEESKFGINAMLNSLHIPDRPKVLGPPAFPKEFSVSSLDRQSSFTPMFLADTQLINIQINNWLKRNTWITKKTPGLKGDSLTAVFGRLKKSIDKIRSRGGQVLFVRPPSSGGYLQAELIVYPRKQYWDQLLAYTNTPGIHFEDYPETANFICPEWSHLAPDDAIAYTKSLVRMVEEKGWKFPHKPAVQ